MTFDFDLAHPIYSGRKIDRLFSSMKTISKNWSDKKSIVMLALDYCIDQAETLNDILVSLDLVESVSDFGSTADEIIRILTGRLSENAMVALETSLISKKGRDAAKNTHFIFEIMQIFEDEGIYGDPVIILNSFKSSFGLENPFSFDAKKWDDMVIAKVAYTSARTESHFKINILIERSRLMTNDNLFLFYLYFFLNRLIPTLTKNSESDFLVMLLRQVNLLLPRRINSTMRTLELSPLQILIHFRDQRSL